jgi:stage III sporulation protein AF
MYEWIQRITAYLIVSTAVSNLINGQSYQKYIRLVMGVILIVLLAEPVFLVIQKLDDYQWNLEQYIELDELNDKTEEMNEGEKIIEKAKEAQKNELTEQLKTSIINQLNVIALEQSMIITEYDMKICEDLYSEDYGKLTLLNLEMKIKLYPLSRTFLKLEILIDGHLSFA